MASYNITGEDYKLTQQSILEITIQIDVYDDYGHYLDTIMCGVISAGLSINAESDVRRTASLDVIPMKKANTIISEDGLVWLNRNVVISLGVKDLMTNKYKFYPMGTYLIMTSSSSYDAVTNTLSLSLSDWVAKLDGSRNGNLGQLKIVYPAYNDYFSTLWVEIARNEGVDVNNEDALLNWAKNNPSDEYHNKLTESNDPEVRHAVYMLMMGNLSPAEQDAYMTIINGIYPNAILYEYRTMVSDTPVVIKTIREYSIIREAMMTCLGQLGYIKDRDIDELGESKGMPYHFPGWDWMAYRQENYFWNKIPYDLEFAKGCTVWQIITTMRDLYEKYECYFDIYNTFCCNLMPRGYDEPVIFDNDFLQSILISENTSINFDEVKNVTEVWGAILEADWYAFDNVGFNGETYTATISGYTDATHTNYYNGDLIAIKIPGANSGHCYLNINSLGKIPIYDENYEIPIDGSSDTMNLEANQTYTFKIVKKRENGVDITRAYLLGQYQCHAMCVLTDGTTGEKYTTTGGVTVEKYSKEYFQKVYNVDNVYMDVVPDSPFTIQRLGIILNVYDDESNIQSCSTALETARQENYRVARLTDTINIVTKLIPYADVNQKVEYKRSDLGEIQEYLVTALSHDMAGGTTSWTLTRYYPLYIDTTEEE